MLSSFIYLTNESVLPTLLRFLLILLFSCLWIIYPKTSSVTKRWHRFLVLTAVLFFVDLIVLFSQTASNGVSGMTLVWIWLLAPIFCLSAALLIRFNIRRTADKQAEESDGANSAEAKPNFGLMLRIFCVTEALNFLVLCMSCASSCAKGSIGKFTTNESQTHFAQFEQSLLAVVEAYGLELKNESSVDDQEHADITYIIEVDRNSDIEINVFNYQLDIFNFEGRGEERFKIEYFLRNRAAEFDFSLFSSLVNCVSGYSTTSEWCENFLNESELTPPDSYESTVKTRYGNPDPKSDKWRIYSKLPVNTAVQSEYYYEDYYAALGFSGLTSSEWWDWKLF